MKTPTIAPTGIAGEADLRPSVRMPREALPGAVIAICAAILALGLFFVVNGNRASGEESGAGGNRLARIASPPALAFQDPYPGPSQTVLPRAAAPVFYSPVVLQPRMARSTIENPSSSRAPPPSVYDPAQLTPALPALKGWPDQPAATSLDPPSPAQRLQDPRALIIDGGAMVGAAAAPRTLASPSQTVAGQPAASGSVTARPKALANPGMVIPVGSMLSAVLETPIDTARPGMARAVVSKDARGFDGTQVLVPRGSRLIGEYQADVHTGQNRVLVTWNTLVLPDGTQVELKSPAADPLGGAGVPGRVHSYFLARFANSLLQSALSLGSNLAVRSVQDGAVIVSVPGAQVGPALGQGLFPADGYRPKITVRQGAAIKVFVARDLDFSEVSTSAPARP